jgi:ATP:ADP antiporter, AAA family
MASPEPTPASTPITPTAAGPVRLPADPAPSALLDLRPGEGRATALAFAYFAALLGGYYVLRAVREEMGIRGGVGRLHESFLATFLVMLVAVPLYSALVARVPRARAIPIAYRVFLAVLLGFVALVAIGVAPALVARSFFVWISVYNLFVVSIFWSYLADLFTSEQGKRLFGLVAAGGSAGAIAGPAAAVALAGLVGVPGLLLLAAVLLEVATRCAGALERAAVSARPAAAEVPAAPGSDARDAPVGGHAWSGLTLTLRSPYLLALAGLTLLGTVTATIVYFQQARLVSELVPDSATRLRLFASIDLAVNLVALGLQSAAFARLVARAGLGMALALHPLTALGGLLLVAASPTLLVVALVQGLRRAIHYAIEKPAREVLFTVVPRGEKYQAKGFIDTIVYRGGDALAAQGAAVLSAGGLVAVSLAAVPACLGWLALVGWVRGRHATLEASR